MDDYGFLDSYNDTDVDDMACVYAGCEQLRQFDEVYSKNVHNPLMILICCFGTLANTCNIVVLSQRRMQTPTNRLLTGLSVAQLGLVLNNLALSTYEMFKHSCTPGMRTKPWATFKLVSVNLSVVFHTIAISHTCLLATFRYFAVQRPVLARRFVTVEMAKRCSILLFLSLPLICTPVYFGSSVAEVDVDETEADRCDRLINETKFDIDFVDEQLLSAILWLYGTLFKLVPCLLITVLSIGLVQSLKRIEQRKRKLMSRGDSAVADEKWQRNRITKMLLAIVLLFVAIEFPQGLVNLLTGVLGYHFAYEVYNRLADMLSMLTLLYSSINFVLYCSMSSQFRAAFKDTFKDIFVLSTKRFLFIKYSYSAEMYGAPCGCVCGEQMSTVEEYRMVENRGAVTQLA